MNAIEGTIIHFGELTLKGRNRNIFINKLIENIKEKTDGTIRQYNDRLFLVGGNYSNLKNVFGISWYAKAWIVDKNIDAVSNFVVDSISRRDIKSKSFALYIKRSDKSFKPDSQELARLLGQKIADKHSLKVNLKKPDIPIYIEIADEVFIHFEKINALGGLPVGMGGKALSLLSGGIDSPVASYLMIKRGCEVDFIHFHAFKNNQQAFDSKISQIASNISMYQSSSTISYVPYNIFQKKILQTDIKRGYELVLFRLFMFKLAEEFAVLNKYNALICGDCLSQVASQTVENIFPVYSQSKIPIFHPLISFDKNQIINISKTIDTYELSIQNYKECCSLVAQNPRTKVKPDILLEEADKIDLDEIIKESLALINSYDLE